MELGAGSAAAIEGTSTVQKSRRKRPLSLYSQAAQSLGFAAAKIEHAAEVQLFTSDQQPAGKVPTILCVCIYVVNITLVY